MKGIWFYLLLIFTLSIGCSIATESECESDECLKRQAYDSVIAVHDEVMAKMSYISELKGRIEEQMNAADDTLIIGDWQELMENLDKADEGMREWMHQFNADIEDVPIDEALAYLKSEKEKIDSVAKEVNGALTEAEKRLKE